MTKQFLQGFQFVVRMKLPGGAVEQNADLIESDGTMVWNLDPTASQTLKARTEAGAPQSRPGQDRCGQEHQRQRSIELGGSGFVVGRRRW
jgi:hypothetical protein